VKDRWDLLFLPKPNECREQKFLGVGAKVLGTFVIGSITGSKNTKHYKQ